MNTTTMAHATAATSVPSQTRPDNGSSLPASEALADDWSDLVLQLRIRDGLSVDCIATQFGVTRAAVNSALRKAQADLMATDFSPLGVRCMQLLNLQQLVKVVIRQVDRLDAADPATVKPGELVALVNVYLKLSRRQAEIVGSDVPAGPRSVGADVRDLLDDDEREELDAIGRTKHDAHGWEVVRNVQQLIGLQDRLVSSGIGGLTPEERSERKASAIKVGWKPSDIGLPGDEWDPADVAAVMGNAAEDAADD